MISKAMPAEAVIWVGNMLWGRGLNDRLHWATRAKYTKQERGQVAWAFDRHGLDGHRLPAAPYEVNLVRVYSGRERELDDDNWVGAAKGSRDQVALQLGVNDGDRQAVRFTYAQERGPRSGLRIEIRTRAA